MYTHAHLSIYIYIHVYVCMYVCICVYTYMYTSLSLSIYIYIYTHMGRTRARWSVCMLVKLSDATLFIDSTIFWILDMSRVHCIFYTPPPPGSDFRDCEGICIETEASIHHTLWVVVVYKVDLPTGPIRRSVQRLSDRPGRQLHAHGLGEGRSK